MEEKNKSIQSGILEIPPIASLLKQSKNLEKRLAAIYKWVRDIPFEVRLDTEGHYKNLAYIKANKRGSCSQKHYFLGTIYEDLGVSVEYLTYPFYWHELPVAFPCSLKKLAKRLPLTYHLAIRICIEEKRFLLDATWDSPLEKAGFPINEMGSELTNTKIAVVPAGGCIIHANISEREKFIKTINASRGEKMSQEEIKFYIALNIWLEHIRKTYRVNKFTRLFS